MRTAVGIGLALVAVLLVVLMLLPDNGPEPEPPLPAAAELTVLSDRAGATVEVGIKAVGGIVTAGTGRVVGETPIMNLELTDTDVSYGPTFTNLYVEVRLDGYSPHLEAIGLGDSGLEPGETYEIDIRLSAP